MTLALVPIGPELCWLEQCNRSPLWLLQATALGGMQGDFQTCIQKLANQQAAAQDAQSKRRAAEQESKELGEAARKLDGEVQQVGCSSAQLSTCHAA